MPIWKANADEKRAIRAVAAAGENRSPQSILIEVGERVALNVPDGTDWKDMISTNLLTFGPDDGLDRSNLHQPIGWSELDRGIELVDGKALVDFYVYEKLVGDQGDLLTNVQAHVETIEGKPRLKMVTGTGILPVSGETLWAFMHPPKRRQFGTRAFNLVQDWLMSLRTR